MLSVISPFCELCFFFPPTSSMDDESEIAASMAAFLDDEQIEESTRLVSKKQPLVHKATRVAKMAGGAIFYPCFKNKDGSWVIFDQTKKEPLTPNGLPACYISSHAIGGPFEEICAILHIDVISPMEGVPRETLYPSHITFFFMRQVQFQPPGLGIKDIHRQITTLGALQLADPPGGTHFVKTVASIILNQLAYCINSCMYSFFWLFFHSPLFSHFFRLIQQRKARPLE